MLKKSLKIDKTIYSKEVILSAIVDFESVAKITYKDSVISVESESDIDEIINEFMNYCLGLQNELI